MECYNDQEVFHALIKKVEELGQGKRNDRIVGSLGFSDKDPQGFQNEGFSIPSL